MQFKCKYFSGFKIVSKSIWKELKLRSLLKLYLAFIIGWHAEGNKETPLIFMKYWAIICVAISKSNDQYCVVAVYQPQGNQPTKQLWIKTNRFIAVKVFGCTVTKGMVVRPYALIVLTISIKSPRNNTLDHVLTRAVGYIFWFTIWWPFNSMFPVIFVII